MKNFTIYHNPRCQKSRQTLQLLKDNGVEPTVIEYLKTPPSIAELQQLLKLLDVEPAAVIRKKEHDALFLPATTDSKKLLERIAAHPEILERPIVVCGKKACLGRPPENVLALL